MSGAPAILEPVLHPTQNVRELWLEHVRADIADIHPRDAVQIPIQGHEPHLQGRREPSPPLHLYQIDARAGEACPREFDHGVPAGNLTLEEVFEIEDSQSTVGGGASDDAFPDEGTQGEASDLILPVGSNVVVFAEETAGSTS